MYKALGLAAILSLAASVANATCFPSNLAGIWDMYIPGLSSDGVGASVCEVAINSAGYVSGVCPSINPSLPVDSSISGNLILQSDCTLDGSLFVSSFPGNEYAVFGSLDRRRDVMLGITGNHPVLGTKR